MRKAKTPSGRPFTLTDTVGFVRHLPHQLVDAFRSTLEEAAEADLILHVVDGSDADPQAQLAAVRGVLAEIGAENVPELVVINKIDDADPVSLKALQLRERGSVLVSAKTGEGLDELRAAIEEALPDRDRVVRVTVPYSRGDLVARAHAAGEVTPCRARSRRHAASRPRSRRSWPLSCSAARSSSWARAAAARAGLAAARPGLQAC